MKVLFRATAELVAQVRRDLTRPHEFADERVGFLAVRATSGYGHLVLLADRYYPVADQDYIPDFTIGARIGQDALRKALETSLVDSVGMFHVHAHDFPGKLRFSRVDLQEQENFVPDFFNVCETMPHGALVMNQAELAGRVWLSKTDIRPIDEFNTVGARMEVALGPRSDDTNFYA